MFTRKKKAKRNFIDSVSGRSTVIPFTDSKLGLDFLVSFFAAIRPSKEKKDATKNMQFVLAEMQQHPVLLKNLQHAILSQLVNTDISHALTDSGIPLSRGFW